MAASKGNQWWRLRAKHGRDKIFSSPEMLWEAACEYFKATDERKWTEEDWVGKDATPVIRNTDTPYTLSGLCLFLDCDDKTFYNYGESESHKDFFPIVTRIRQIIYTQKFEGAAVGAFNANIIARDLGLKDKQENTVKVNAPDAVELAKKMMNI